MENTKPDQTLIIQGNQLWQAYLLANSQAAIDTSYHEQNPDQESFWQDYQEMLQAAKKQQSNHQHTRSLVWNAHRFVTNQSEYKSVLVPTGNFLYKDLRMSLQGFGLAGCIVLWFFNWPWLDASPSIFFSIFLILFQIVSPFLVISKIITLFRRNERTQLTITSKYLYDHARKKIIAFKNIKTIKKSWFGLKLVHQSGQRRRNLIVPKQAEEYQDIKHFFEQVAQVNHQSIDTYVDLPTIFKSYWPNENTVTYAPKKSYWKPFRKYQLIHINITAEHLIFTLEVRQSQYTIDLPLNEIYYLRESRKRLRVLDHHKRFTWPTNDVQASNFKPALPRNLPGFHKIRIFLEEVAVFNHRSQFSDEPLYGP